MRYKEFIAVLIICYATGCGNNANPVVSSGDNSAPVIQALTFSPELVKAGQSCIVICTAFDPDSDNLSYEWESIGNISKSISNSGATVIYTPNSCCGAPQIKVTVKDGKGGSADSFFTVPFTYDE